MLDEAESIPEFDRVPIDLGLRHGNGALIAIRVYALCGLDLPVSGQEDKTILGLRRVG